MTRKIVLAPDSFKESMTAKEVCIAMEKGIRNVFEDVEIVHVPMADGGEGTVDSLVDSSKGKRIDVSVMGPIPDTKVKSYFGLLGDGETAVIEMAKVNGLELLKKEERNPLITTTFGTGQVIKAALDAEIKKLIIAIGGSATNDGGAGMAMALGAKLLNENDEEIPLGGGHLDKLARIDISELDERLKDVNIVIASDVQNPLVGPEGAAHVFGPQKGATPEIVETLDKNLDHYADIIKSDLGMDVKDVQGAGAAGGLGAGLLVFTGAEMQNGVDIVTEQVGLEEAIADANCVFTGEGGMDFQTKYGKAPAGVAQVAKKQNVPVYALVGKIGKDIEVLYDEGMTAIFGVLDGGKTHEDDLKNGSINVTRTAQNVARLMKSL